VPQVIAAVWALCSETDEEAERLASSSRMAFTLFLQGTLIRVPPIETAVKFLEEHPDEVQAFGSRRRGIVGSPAKVRAQLEAVADEYGADELMIVTITYDHGARRRSYELIAEAFSANP
jgi:alkanesulfonate monooxygenase SsuD/methylene tetrahydromethanopterin reductase-like flavin-dependent oxidoreductase (luciferase family)